MTEAIYGNILFCQVEIYKKYTKFEKLIFEPYNKLLKVLIKLKVVHLDHF